mgnify:FL=1|jgi:hypothetical protein
MKKPLLTFLLLLSNLMISQNAEILEDLNLAKFDNDFSTYNQLTSIYCSQISEVAYWDSDEINELNKLMNEKYPDDNHHWELIDHYDKKDHTQALLWGNKNFLIIAFRGTEPSLFKDWITDAKFWNYENNPDSKEDLANMPAGHGGFRRSLMSLITKEDIFKKIDEIILKCSSESLKSNFPIYLTGHSLGAAISQLFIEPLNYKGYNFSGAYHFAPPLAVSCTLNDYMKEKYGDMVYDIVNYKDYVPRAGRNGVAHFGKFHRICKNGLIYSETEAYIKFRFFEYFSEIKLHSLNSHTLALKNTDNTVQKIKERSIEDYSCLEPKTVVNPCGSTK